MTWFGWLLIGFLGYSSLLCIAQIGKPREPATSAVAIGTVLLVVLIAVGIFTVGTGSL